jgi:ABC-type nickel/cobalt efflux system permease component RcnA
LPEWVAPDASPIGNAGAEVTGRAAPGEPSGAPAGLGAVPGGIGGELSSFVGTADLTPLVFLTSLLIALGLGALHALSPGHGKTVMAAYLVGSRGSARHAIALGLTVTAAHTLGVLALAAITLLAADVLPPERIYPILGLTSGALVIAIGGWLLLVRYREWRARLRPDSPAPNRNPTALDDDAHGHAHPHEDDRAPENAHAHEHDPSTHAHSHGGLRHSHAPTSPVTLSWQSLFALGFSGGLVPSASALILLLGSIAAGRVEYGLVLVLAFGAGMACVLGGIGFVLVRASRLIDRLPSARLAGRLAAAMPVATALVVVVAGIFLTGQALVQAF